MKFLFTPLILMLSNPVPTQTPWQQQHVNTDASFRGLGVVSEQVAWVSGTKGTYVRTTDSGMTWTVGTVPGAEKLDFRDVEAFGKDTAYLLSAGPGAASRIYKTTDAGKTWTLQFQNADPEGFYDALAFWDERHGVVLGDPIQGHFQLLLTEDGGATWKRLPTKSLPPALPGEGAFAASGTCLVARGARDLWFCTGGAKVARLFHSPDRGQTWTVQETPLRAGIASAGIFSLAFRDNHHAMIVGGDYQQPQDTTATVAISSDGGNTWTLLDRPFGYCSGVAWARDRWVAVGTSGSHMSLDDGRTWKQLDSQNYNSVAFTASGHGWAVGPNGRIAKFVR